MEDFIYEKVLWLANRLKMNRLKSILPFFCQCQILNNQASGNSDFMEATSAFASRSEL